MKIEARHVSNVDLKIGKDVFSVNNYFEEYIKKVYINKNEIGLIINFTDDEENKEKILLGRFESTTFNEDLKNAFLKSDKTYKTKDGLRKSLQQIMPPVKKIFAYIDPFEINLSFTTAKESVIYNIEIEYDTFCNLCDIKEESNKNHSFCEVDLNSGLKLLEKNIKNFLNNSLSKEIDGEINKEIDKKIENNITI